MTRCTSLLHDVLIGRLEVEADAMWSFVKQKANKQWVWIAMDTQTRQIITFYVGDRSHESAKQLWANLPAVSREQATFSTDQYAAYTGSCRQRDTHAQHDAAEVVNSQYNLS